MSLKLVYGETLLSLAKSLISSSEGLDCRNRQLHSGVDPGIPGRSLFMAAIAGHARARSLGARHSRGVKVSCGFTEVQKWIHRVSPVPTSQSGKTDAPLWFWNMVVRMLVPQVPVLLLSKACLLASLPYFRQDFA